MKINTLYLPKYAPELAKIYFENGANITILKYLKLNSLPSDLQNTIINQDFKSTLKLIRKYNKITNSNKFVKINYSCNVFSTVSNTWHQIQDILAQGFYNNAQDIKKIIDKKRSANNNENVKNLCFEYAFNMR